jgi:predicted GNAT family acetyltransferase
MLEIQDLTDTHAAQARTLLERHCETSLALLGNMADHGLRLAAHVNSGNIKVILEQARVVAVFVLTRRGHLLLQTDRARDYSALILEACLGEPMPMTGVLGDWALAEPFWQAFTARQAGVETTFRSREVLYRLALAPAASSARGENPRSPVRALVESDFAAWCRCHDDFLAEAGLPPGSPLAQRYPMFVEKAALGHYWGYFEQGELASMATLTPGGLGVGQIGGVYTPNAYRRRGFSKATLIQLLQAAKNQHDLTAIVLFTGDDNLRAQAMYEGLGFESIGHFGLFFGHSA